MKKLTRLISGIAFAVSLNCPFQKIYGQNQIEKKETANIEQTQNTEANQKLFPNFNFYFEIKEEEKYIGHPKFYNNATARLSISPKEKNFGSLWFRFGDTNNDGSYDYTIIQNNFVGNIGIEESFKFYLDKKELDYTLRFQNMCGKPINECEIILEKYYSRITMAEAQAMGEDFTDRVKKIYNIQNNFDRFLPNYLETLVREEAGRWQYTSGDHFIKTGFPINKYFTKEEIDKINSSIFRQGVRK